MIWVATSTHRLRIDGHVPMRAVSPYSSLPPKASARVHRRATHSLCAGGAARQGKVSNLRFLQTHFEEPAHVPASHPVLPGSMPHTIAAGEKAGMTKSTKGNSAQRGAGATMSRGDPRETVAATPTPSRRALLRLGGAMATALLATACIPWTDRFLTPVVAPSEGEPLPPPREAVQLVYQDWQNDWASAMVATMLTRFHEAHPDIHIFFTPAPTNLADAMLADMQMGTAPDLFWGGSTLFPTWAQQGHMLDLRDYVAADVDATTVAEWDPAQYAAFFLHNGHQFGLPKYHGTIGLYYNQDHFDAAGIAYPDEEWTHSEYLAAMHQLSDLPTEGSGAGQTRSQWGSMMDIAWDRLQIHANAWGGHLVAPYNAAHCVADRPAAAAAFEWLRARIWDDRVMASFADVQYMSPRSAFTNQRVAMVEEGSWLLKEILLNSDFRVGVAPLPKGPRRRVTLATTDGFGIYAETEYPDEAWQLLQFLTGREYGLAMAKANLLQPARVSLIDDWIGFVHAEFPAKAQDLDLDVFVAGHRNGNSVATEIAENMSEVQPRLTATFESIFMLGQSPVSELQAVCAQLNQWQRDETILLPRLAH